MRLRYVVTGVLGLLLVGAVVITARVSLLQDAPDTTTLPEMVPVYVAKGDIPFGTALTEAMVAVQSWPRAAVPPLAITDPGLLFRSGEGGRIAKDHFVPGEMLIASKLSSFGEDVAAIAPVGETRRAVAVQVSGEAVTGGLVAPGDLIDLVFVDGEARNLRAILLMQGVRVLGLAEAGRITLEVSARQGQEIALAQEAGALVALLHLGTLAGEVALPAIELRALTQDAPEVAPTPDGPTVVIRRGNEATVEPVGGPLPTQP